MYTYTKEELINKIYSDPDVVNLTLYKKDAIEIIPYLINNGYAVCATSGEVADRLHLSVIYAGDVDDLDYADSTNIIFANREYFDSLVWEDYEESEVTNE